jgi:TPR repeat protein/serine/threonine protein kinase
MNALPVAHPSAETLQAFADAKVADTVLADAVYHHLETCPACREKVAARSGDEFLKRLREARGDSCKSIPTRTPAATGGAIQAVKLETTEPPQVPDLPPELVNHPEYEVQRELGRGGMGVVYLVINKHLQQPEVLKVMNKALIGQAGTVERFLREMRAAAKLSRPQPHPNITTIYSALEVGDYFGFTMEYVPGEDLARILKRNGGPLPVASACYYALQTALGLQHAFEKGMVHRDIKPQNLILTKHEKKHVIKILDFGLAKVRSEKEQEFDLTGPDKAMGTPEFMAPEQWRDAASADIRADIYSLGCTMYFLLSGHVPFKGRSYFEICEAHHSETAKPLNLVRSEVSADLAAVVAKMMGKSPAQRFQTPVEVVHALAPFVRPGAKRPPAEVVPVVEAVPPRPRPPSSVKKPAVDKEPVLDVLPVVPNKDTVLEGKGTIQAAQRLSAPGRVQAPPGKRSGKRLSVFGILLVILLGVGTAIAAVKLLGDRAPQGNRDDEIIAEDVAAVEQLLRAGKPSKGYVEKVGPGRIPIWRAAAERGSPDAQWLLSRCYQEGAGVEKDHEKAVDLLRQAAAKGNVYAENNLGYCYNKGEGVGKNVQEAVTWYRKAADKGLAIAQRNLGFCYKDGEGLPQDWTKAREWFQKAADQNDIGGEYQLGLIYFNGYGLEKPDQAEAARWFRRAADAGDGDAQDELGRMYSNGWGVEKDVPEGARWFRLSADQGNAFGQGNLGRAYLNGEGVEKNDEQAIAWLEKAVAQNVTYAPTNRTFRWNLGIAFNNRGKFYLEAKDADTAFLFYRRAAEVNDKLVQEVPRHFIHRIRLGISYIGLGDLRAQVKDFEPAAKWYIKASDLGCSDASKKLADLFEQGQGVPKQADEAARLRKLAENQAVKQFTVPCEVKGMPQKVPLPVYVTNAFKGNHPLEEEELRLHEDHDATLPKEVKDSFNRLYEISRQNNVSFVDLCVYALGKSNEKEGAKKE